MPITHSQEALPFRDPVFRPLPMAYIHVGKTNVTKAKHLLHDGFNVEEYDRDCIHCLREQELQTQYHLMLVGCDYVQSMVDEYMSIHDTQTQEV